MITNNRSCINFKKIKPAEFAEKMAYLAVRFGWILIGSDGVSLEGPASYWQCRNHHNYRVETRLINQGTKIVFRVHRGADESGFDVLAYLHHSTFNKPLPQLEVSSNIDSQSLVEVLIRMPFLDQVRSLFAKAEAAHEKHKAALNQAPVSARALLEEAMPWRSSDLSDKPTDNRVLAALGQGGEWIDLELFAEYDTTQHRQVFDLSLEGLTKEQAKTALSALQSALGKGFEGF